MTGAAGAQGPTEHPAPGATPGRCVDHVRPTSSFTRRQARRAGRRRVLRGTARDVGCGVDRVTISVARKRGKRCRQLKATRRLSRLKSCGKRTWLPVKGTTRWSFRIPKRLHKGRYLVRTRAVDFAGNVQRTHRRKLRLR